MPPAPIASSSKKVPIKTPGSGKAAAAGPVCATACNRRAVLLEGRTTVGGSGEEGTASPSDAGSLFEIRLSELSKLLIGSEICIDSSSSERGSSLRRLPYYAIWFARNLQKDMNGDKHSGATLSNMILDKPVAAVNGPWCRACLKTLADSNLHTSARDRAVTPAEFQLSLTNLPQPRTGRQFIAWRRQPQESRPDQR